MQDFMIVLMYLCVGGTMAGGAALLYLASNGLFYVFCWGFCKIDSYLQERYWRRLQNTLKFNNKNNIKEAA